MSLKGVLIWHYDVDQAYRWRDIHLFDNTDLNGQISKLFKMVKNAPMYIHIQYYRSDPWWEYEKDVDVEIVYARWTGEIIWQTKHKIKAALGLNWIQVGDLMNTNVDGDFYICIITYEDNRSTGLVYIPVSVFATMQPIEKHHYGVVEIQMIPIMPWVSEEEAATNLMKFINEKLAYEKEKLGATCWIENLVIDRSNPMLHVATADIYYASPVPAMALLIAIIAAATFGLGVTIGYIIISLQIRGTAEEIKGKSEQIIRNSEEVKKEMEEIQNMVTNWYNEGKISDKDYSEFTAKSKKVIMLVSESEEKAREIYNDSNKWVNVYSSLTTQLTTMMIASLIPLMVIFMFFALLISVVRR